ncbi:MAG: NAD-dependent epimerase [Halioglobus sp.]|nr:NAD-dependent epimerase [Halioglobus sp.]|tara:strand:- start:1732 stop:2493 length:762 start_codon:yes stop_codon:yes gene_type:complete
MGKYLVTGGAAGIGGAVVETLRGEGHSVVVVDIRGGDVNADLSTSDGRSAAIRELQGSLEGGLDGFVSCAGVGPHFQPVEEIASLNFFGTIDLLQGVRSRLSQRKGAAVLVSSNTAAYERDEELARLLGSLDECGARAYCAGIEGQSAYATSKYCVATWMRNHVRDYSRDGIRLNAVAPGFTKTALTDAGRKNPEYGPMIEEFIKTIPVGFEGKPTDISAAICFLLRREASYVCGSVLFVDGGHDATLRPDLF